MVTIHLRTIWMDNYPTRLILPVREDMINIYLIFLGGYFGSGGCMSYKYRSDELSIYQNSKLFFKLYYNVKTIIKFSLSYTKL